MHHEFMNLTECVGGRIWLAVLATVLDLATVTGYLIIGADWQRSRSAVLDRGSPADRALAWMRNIFVFCGFCGYLFTPFKFFAPRPWLPYVWGTWLVAMLFLVFYTYAYIYAKRRVRVIFEEVAFHQNAAQTIDKIEECVAGDVHTDMDMEYVKGLVRELRSTEREIRRRLGLPPH